MRLVETLRTRLAKPLSGHPQFVDKCEWSKIDGYRLATLLAAQPELAGLCASRLTDRRKASLIADGLHLEKYLDQA